MFPYLPLSQSLDSEHLKRIGTKKFGIYAKGTVYVSKDHKRKAAGLSFGSGKAARKRRVCHSLRATGLSGLFGGGAYRYVNRNQQTKKSRAVGYKGVLVLSEASRSKWLKSKERATDCHLNGGSLWLLLQIFYGYPPDDLSFFALGKILLMNTKI